MEKYTNDQLTKRSLYHYDLPEELIAQSPAEPRDSARLLVYDRKNDKVEHKVFRDIIDYLKPGDVLVLNNSRVIPARIYGIKEETGAKIEMLLQKRIDYTHWEVIAKPCKRLKVGTIVKFSDELSAKLTKIVGEGICEVEFMFDGVFEDILDRIGSMPLPHYIKKKLEDSEQYQTVYSKEKGSSAAPTAGLHWTKELLERVKAKGVIVLEVMLHVGLGTFRPVKDDCILNHKMHSEYYVITKDVADQINLAKKEGRRVIAVGTTSVRVLESASDENGVVHEKAENTSIFIYPPYKMKVVDALITNFHLPESTLIMLVSTMMGVDKTLEIYNIAVKEKYRFFSFGDAMFIM